MPSRAVWPLLENMLAAARDAVDIVGGRDGAALGADRLRFLAATRTVEIIGKAVRYRYGDVLAFIETRRATSTLAARALKPAALPVEQAECETASVSPAMPKPKRKRTARSESGACGQTSLF